MLERQNFFLKEKYFSIFGKSLFLLRAHSAFDLADARRTRVVPLWSGFILQDSGLNQ